VGVTVGGMGRDSDFGQKGPYALPTVAPRTEAMDHERLGHDRAHGHARIQRTVRVLKDHLQAATPWAQVACRKPAQIGRIAQVDAACVGPDKLQNQAREGGFPASAFSNEAERFPAAERERHTADRVKQLFGAADNVATDDKCFSQFAHSKKDAIRRWQLCAAISQLLLSLRRHHAENVAMPRIAMQSERRRR